MYTSQEIENQLIGSLISNNEYYWEVENILDETDFYDLKCRRIWVAMVETMEKRRDYDLVILSNYFNTKPDLGIKSSDIVEISTKAGERHKCVEYAYLVKEASISRKAFAVLEGHANRLKSGDDVFVVEESLQKALARCYSVNEYDYPEKVGDGLEELLEQFRKEASGEIEVGLKCGIKEIDDITTGFRPSEFISIGAPPSVGKSTIALQMAIYIANNFKLKEIDKKVLYVSMEMSTDEFRLRALSHISRINSYSIKMNKLRNIQKEKQLPFGIRILETLPLYFYSKGGVTHKQIESKIRELGNVAIVFVDYVGIMGGEYSDIRIRTMNNLVQLKNIATNHNIPVVGLGQFDRAESKENQKKRLEGKKTLPPSIFSFTESSTWEQVSNISILLDRPDGNFRINEDGSMTFIDEQLITAYVAKNRGGELGSTELFTRMSIGSMGTTIWEQQIHDLIFGEDVAYTNRVVFDEFQEYPNHDTPF